MYVHECIIIITLPVSLGVCCITVTQVVISGVQIKKAGKHLEDGRIKLLDHLCKICDQEVAAMGVKELEETVIAPKTKIILEVDGTFAVTADLKPFLKTGLMNLRTAPHVQYSLTIVSHQLRSTMLLTSLPCGPLVMCVGKSAMG